MALLHSVAAGTRDTLGSSLGGFPARVMAHAGSGSAFLVTVSDLDDYLHMWEWDGEEVTEYVGSSLIALDANAKQSGVAALLIDDTIHVLYFTTVGGTKRLTSASFDVSNLQWNAAQTTVISGGNATIAADAVDLCEGPNKTLHGAVWHKDSGGNYDLYYIQRSASSTWTSEVVLADQTTAPVYMPVIDVDSGGRVLVLSDDGTTGLTSQGHWTAWEKFSGVWVGSTVSGLGQASATHTPDGNRHVLFFGDKRHTVIASTADEGVETTLGAVQFEQPDVDGGIIQGVNYGFGFAVMADGNDLRVVAAANGKLYQGNCVGGVWGQLRAISDLTSSRKSKVAAFVSREKFDDGTYAVAVKLDDAGGKGWYFYHVDKESPPRGGITHEFTLDGVGFRTASPLQKADISQAIPRISLATEIKSEGDISDLSSVSQSSWHHGRGQLYMEDPDAYLDAEGLLLHIPNQATPQYATVPTERAASVTAAVAMYVGEGEVGEDAIGKATPGSLVAGGDDFGGYPVDAVLYQGNYYILVKGDAASDNVLYVLNNTTGLWDVVTSGIDTSAGEPSDLEIFNEDLWVAQGEGHNARAYDFSATSWVDTGVPADCLKWWDGKLWRADNINEIYYSEDADLFSSATWEFFGTADDGSGTTRRIRRFEPYGNLLLVFCDFGVMQISNFGGAYIMLPLLDDSPNRNPNNALAAANFGGLLYYNVGDGLTRFDGATRIEMGPNRSPIGGDKFQPMLPEKQGQFTSLVATDTLMYMAVDAGDDGVSTVQVYGGTGWNEFWHGEKGERCRWVFHTPPLTTTGILRNRLLWLEIDGQIHYMVLPRSGENPLNDPDVRFRAGNSPAIITSWFGPSPSLFKVAHNLLARFENFGTGELDPNLHIYFQIEDGEDSFDSAEWTYLATFSQTPVEEIDILNRIKWTASPSNYGGAIGGLTYKQVRFLIQFDMNLGGAEITTTPPVLRSFGQRFAIRTPRRYGFSGVIQAYDDIIRLDRSMESMSAVEIRNTIYGFADMRTPHFLDDGTLVPLVNWVLNPGFEKDSNDDGLADRWVKVNSGAVTTSISEKHKTHGRRSQKVTVAGSNLTSGIEQAGLYLPPGVPAHVEMNIFVESGIGALLRVVDAGTGALIARPRPVAPNVLTRPPLRFVDSHVDIEPQETLVELAVQVVVPAGMADGSTSTTLYADSAMMYMGEEEPHYYVDGEQPRCQWIDDTVEAYLTPSYRRGSYAVYITGINEVFRTYNETQDGANLKESEITFNMREAGV